MLCQDLMAQAQEEKEKKQAEDWENVKKKTKNGSKKHYDKMLDL